MLTTNARHGIATEVSEDQASTRPPRIAEVSLVEVLRATLDNIAVGVVVVDGDAHVLHANRAAREMLDGGSPIVSLGGRLGALHEKLTAELRRAIAEAIQAGGEGSIGLPLVNRDMTAATAHIAPVARTGESAANAAAIFVSSANRPSRIDLSNIARIFKLSPAEGRLLRFLVAGVTIADAAVALGVTGATAKTHQSRIYSKVGVSRCTELMIRIGRLLPPICR